MGRLLLPKRQGVTAWLLKLLLLQLRRCKAYLSAAAHCQQLPATSHNWRRRGRRTMQPRSCGGGESAGATRLTFGNSGWCHASACVPVPAAEAAGAATATGMLAPCRVRNRGVAGRCLRLS